MTKPNPSYKSKRYRDKLRHEIRDLEVILPIDRTVLHRKLDSQTVFRMSIAFFRSKLFLQDIIRSSPHVSRSMVPAPVQSQAATDVSPDIDIDQECLLQALDGFLLILTTDGTMLYISNNILHHLGFNQIDLVMRCIYGIIHPDDQEELKTILEDTLMSDILNHTNQDCCASNLGHKICRQVSFLCRMKCFNGATTGYLKMHCAGHLRHFPSVMKSQRTTNQLLFAFCRPFVSITTESASDVRKSGFWTKHDLDLKFKQMDPGIPDSLGHEVKFLEGKSFYQFVHPEDLFVFKSCHKTLISTEEIHTIYFRVQHKDGSYIWVHTRGKVVFKNSKKYSIVFTHCPVREEDSTYIQQEVVLRHRNAIQDLMYPPANPTITYKMEKLNQEKYPYFPDVAEPCPSSWHTTADRHSPVFPNNLHGQALYYKKDARQANVVVQSEGDMLHGGYMTQDANVYKQQEGSFYKHDSNVYTTQDEVYNQYVNTPSYDQQCQQQMYRQYHLQFNGIGISPRQQQYSQMNQSDFPTMLIQGQLTAVEANTQELNIGNNMSSYSDSHDIPTSSSYISQHFQNNMPSCRFDCGSLFTSNDSSYTMNIDQHNCTNFSNQNMIKAESQKSCFKTQPASSCRFPSRKRSNFMGEHGGIKDWKPNKSSSSGQITSITDVEIQDSMKSNILQ